jgi:hypothetical protein
LTPFNLPAGTPQRALSSRNRAIAWKKCLFGTQILDRRRLQSGSGKMAPREKPLDSVVQAWLSAWQSLVEGFVAVSGIRLARHKKAGKILGCAVRGEPHRTAKTDNRAGRRSPARLLAARRFNVAAGSPRSAWAMPRACECEFASRIEGSTKYRAHKRSAIGLNQWHWMIPRRATIIKLMTLVILPS